MTPHTHTNTHPFVATLASVMQHAAVGLLCVLPISSVDSPNTPGGSFWEAVAMGYRLLSLIGPSSRWLEQDLHQPRGAGSLTLPLSEGGDVLIQRFLR